MAQKAKLLSWDDLFCQAKNSSRPLSSRAAGGGCNTTGLALTRTHIFLFGAKDFLTRSDNKLPNIDGSPLVFCIKCSSMNYPSRELGHRVEQTVFLNTIPFLVSL